MTVRILHGDCREVLRTLPDASAQCCVTSPPYYGLRDYGVAGQIGLEPTPDEYVAQMVAVFREVRRVLREDGTVWLNLGDSYAGPGGKSQPHRDSSGGIGKKGTRGEQPYHAAGGGFLRPCIPWRVAFALQADGWYLRSAIVWAKPNPMPESVTDRPTSSYEMVFLLAKAERYFYDAEAVAEPFADERMGASQAAIGTPEQYADNARGGGDKGLAKFCGIGRAGRNLRNVWTIATQPYSGAHFATMPPELAERCIKAGSKPGDTILDPFGGAGTTGLVADRLNRNAVLVELNPEYGALATDRITGDAPLFAEVA